MCGASRSRRGRYNIQNIGIFLWSLNAYSVTQAPAAVTAADPHCFRFSSLGMDMPLFHRAVPQGEEITAAAQPVNVADRLRRRVLCDDLQKGVGAAYYGEGNSLAVYLDDQATQPIRDSRWRLCPEPTGLGSTCRPRAVLIARLIDPELGRIALPPAADWRYAAEGAGVVSLRLQRRYGRRRVSTRCQLHRRE